MLDPSGPVFSSQCQQNRQTPEPEGSRLQTFIFFVDDNHIGDRSTSHQAKGIGGACRDRTDDPLLAKQVLSQLS